MDEAQVGSGKTEPQRPVSGAKRGSARGGDPAQLGHALEVLRVVATLLVVLYHAALTYAHPLRLTLWVAHDQGGLTGFDVFIYWVNGFVMPVFFLAAGVSAPAACESRGPKVFLEHRAKRLLRPLLFASLTILPVFYLIWGYGLMVTGRCDLGSILRWRYSPEVTYNLYGLGHFWFLEYLFLVCVLWCGCWTLRNRLGRASLGAEGGLVARSLASPWRPVLFAIPTSLIFLVDSDTMLRVDNVIVPNLFRLVHYAFFFAVGGWISQLREPKALLIPFGRFYLAFSFVLFAAMSPLLLQHANSPLEGGWRVVFCVLAALFVWLTVFGALGVLLSRVQGRGSAMRFLSEASFWIYIIHVPIVALLQILLLPLAWPLLVKFLVVSVVASGLSVWSYEAIVRRSVVGEIINGTRKRSTKPSWFGPEFGWRASLGAMILLLAVGLWIGRDVLWGDNFHESVAGQLYRSARVKPNALDAMIQNHGLRSVLVFTGDPRGHSWFRKYQEICKARKVELYAINLRDDLAPTRKTLDRLVEVLAEAPRPLIVQGYRGIEHSSFATAVARLLDGDTPDQALNAFGLRYGQFGEPVATPLGRTLLCYQDWLQAHDWKSTPDRFQRWARDAYLVNSFPEEQGGTRVHGHELMARKGAKPIDEPRSVVPR